MKPMDPMAYLEQLEQDRKQVEAEQQASSDRKRLEAHSEAALRYALGDQELGPTQKAFSEEIASRMLAAERGQYVAYPKTSLNKFIISDEGRRPRKLMKR